MMNPSDYSIAAEDLLMLFQTTPDLVCIADKVGYFKNFNPAVPQTLGYTREELLAQPIATHMHPDDREMTLNRRAMLLKGDTMVNFQNRYITKKEKIMTLLNFARASCRGGSISLSISTAVIRRAL